MKCPHCLTEYHDSFKNIFWEEDTDGRWYIGKDTCPACKRMILVLEHFVIGQRSWTKNSERFVRPLAVQRPAPPSSVPSPYRDDYIESCAVLPASAKASAALSRRCLQAILRDKGGFAQHDLIDQIDAALKSGLPSHITESLDAVRNIGNFAAHPMKSKTSGALLDVEAGEAEWNLDVLEALFDYYFVQPEIVAKKKAALNAKLAEAGKKPMKS
jgi:hypothetical protein